MKSDRNFGVSGESDLSRYWVPVTVGALLAGIFFRFWDLAGAPLAVDEYFLGTSILNTAAQGLPEFACGGFYARGLPLQYLSVPLLQLGSLEFAVRFWPAVASIVSIVAVWRMGLLVGGPVAALIAVILMSLSVWEVEFARFGRMYAPFQAVFLWYVYFQAQHLLDGRQSACWWYLGLSALAVITYEGAVVLLVLNFLALIWPGKRWTVPYLAVAGGLLFAGFAYTTQNFRHLDVASEESPVIADDSPTFPPSLPFDTPYLPDSLIPLVAVGILFLGVVLWRYRGQFQLRHPSVIFWAFAMLCFCFGLLAFGVALTVAGLLMRLPLRAGLPPRSVLIGLAVLFVVWSALLFSSFWLENASTSFSIKSALYYVLDYPDVYYEILLPWIQAIPATTLALALLALPCIWTLFTPTVSPESTRADLVRYIVAAMILLVLLVAILPLEYNITRYTYFLYPLVIILASAGITTLGNMLVTTPKRRFVVTGALIAGLFALAEDFRVSHLLQINDPEFRYRTAYDPILAGHYYLRWDFRSAAFYVNERLQPNDSVVVFDQPLPHYLASTTGIFIREGTDNHWLVAGCDGTRDLWSNAPLLDQDSEIQDLIDQTTGNTWLITRTSLYPARDPLESALPERYALLPEFTSQDGYLAVYRLRGSSERG